MKKQQLMLLVNLLINVHMLFIQIIHPGSSSTSSSRIFSVAKKFVQDPDNLVVPSYIGSMCGQAYLRDFRNHVALNQMQHVFFSIQAVIFSFLSGILYWIYTRYKNWPCFYVRQAKIRHIYCLITFLIFLFKQQ